MVFYFTKQFNAELTPRRNWRNRLILKHNQLFKTKEIGLGLATSIEATLKEYIERFGQRTHFQPALSIHQMPLFNTLSGYGSYIFPAVASLIIHQTIVLGLVCWLQVTANNMKKLPYSFCRNFCQYLYNWLFRKFYLFGFTLWFNDYPHGGNFVGLLVAVPIFISCVIGLGMLIGSLLDIPERAGHIIVFSSVPLFLLTGAALSSSHA